MIALFHRRGVDSDNPLHVGTPRRKWNIQFAKWQLWIITSVVVAVLVVISISVKGVRYFPAGSPRGGNETSHVPPHAQGQCDHGNGRHPVRHEAQFFVEDVLGSCSASISDVRGGPESMEPRVVSTLSAGVDVPVEVTLPEFPHVGIEIPIRILVPGHGLIQVGGSPSPTPSPAVSSDLMPESEIPQTNASTTMEEEPIPTVAPVPCSSVLGNVQDSFRVLAYDSTGTGGTVAVAEMRQQRASVDGCGQPEDDPCAMRNTGVDITYYGVLRIQDPGEYKFLAHLEYRDFGWDDTEPSPYEPEVVIGLHDRPLIVHSAIGHDALTTNHALKYLDQSSAEMQIERNPCERERCDHGDVGDIFCVLDSTVGNWVPLPRAMEVLIDMKKIATLLVTATDIGELELGHPPAIENGNVTDTVSVRALRYLAGCRSSDCAYRRVTVLNDWISTSSLEGYVWLADACLIKYYSHHEFFDKVFGGLNSVMKSLELPSLPLTLNWDIHSSIAVFNPTK